MFCPEISETEEQADEPWLAEHIGDMKEDLLPFS